MGASSSTSGDMESNEQVFHNLLHQAQISFKSSEYKKALPIYKQVYVFKVSKLGKQHKSIGAIWQTLGVIYAKQMMFQKAMNCLTKALDLTPEDPHEGKVFAAGVWKDLGDVYLLQEINNEALSCYEKILDIGTKLNTGDGNLIVASAYREIGKLYKKIGKYEEALGALNTAINIMVKELGDNDVTTADIYDDIGDIKMNQKKDFEAINLYKKALNIRVRTVGEEHEYVVKSHVRLAHYYVEKKAYEDALYHCDILTGTYLNRSSLNKELLHNVYIMLGSFYSKTGNYTASLDYFSKAKSLCEDNFAPVHPLVANAHDYMGRVYLKDSKLEAALANFNEALRIRLMLFCSDNIETTISYQNIGLAYKALQNPTEAILWLKKAIEVRVSKLGEDDVSLAGLKYEVSLVLEQVNHKEEAQEAMKDYVRLSKKRDSDRNFSSNRKKTSLETLDETGTPESPGSIVGLENSIIF